MKKIIKKLARFFQGWESRFQTEEIELNFSDEDFIKISTSAHKKGLSLNQYINDLLESELRKLESDPEYKEEFVKRMKMQEND